VSDRDPPNGAIAYRLQAIERRLDRIDALEPSVMKAELRDVREDLREIVHALGAVNVQAMARDLVWVKRTMFGFVATFAITAISMAAVLFSGGNP
jgi:hypothetical protein